jgi:hypothetical protein
MVAGALALGMGSITMPGNTETLDAGVDRFIHALATRASELALAEQPLGEALAKYRIDVRRKL